MGRGSGRTSGRGSGGGGRRGIGSGRGGCMSIGSDRGNGRNSGSGSTHWFKDPALFRIVGCKNYLHLMIDPAYSWGYKGYFLTRHFDNPCFTLIKGHSLSYSFFFVAKLSWIFELRCHYRSRESLFKDRYFVSGRGIGSGSGISKRF